MLLLSLLGRDQRGFSMPAVMGTMAVMMSLSLVALGVASGDQGQSDRDQDYKRAYSAAEAGVNEYLFHLNEDQAYWTRCNNVPAPAKVNQPWNGIGNDPRQRRTVPDSDTQYAIELLPNSGFTSCNSLVPTSMIDPGTGTFRIRSTGFAGRTKRSIVATFRRRGFLDFLYYTDLETANPVTYKVNQGGYPSASGHEDAQTWASRECSKPYEGRRNARESIDVRLGSGNSVEVDLECTEINFATGDGVDGPLHTNDQLLVCGRPVFGRNINGIRDPIEVVNPSGWRGNPDCSGNNPTWTGERRFGAPRLDAPPVVALKQVATDDGIVVTGRADIVLTGSGLTINGVARSLPSNGVIYVANGAGSCGFYDPTNTDPSSPQTACGDVLVRGSYTYDLTIAAERDIKIVDDVTRVSGSNGMLGLIAQNFIRVGHPVTNRQPQYNSQSDRFTWTCNTVSGAYPNRVDAAMLAIDHSFIVDNWYCGGQLGNLTVNGAIAQKYRGIVGLIGSSGYNKDYNYDDRLKYRQPPHFLDPIQTGWRVIRQTEQTPAR
jgi:type II secretory pathway pseudopilin PulG